MERYLKHFALIVGFLLLAASMVFSYQGFAFNFASAIGEWKTVFWAIGIVMCVTVTILQMMLSMDGSSLNKTLILSGILSYVYSIWTNYKGLERFVNIDSSDVTTMIIAAFFDVVPEHMIAWSLGEALKGDLLGNLVKWVSPKPVHQSRPVYNQHSKGNKPYLPAQNPSRHQGSQKPVFESISNKLPKKQSQGETQFIVPDDQEFHPVNYDA